MRTGQIFSLSAMALIIATGVVVWSCGSEESSPPSTTGQQPPPPPVAPNPQPQTGQQPTAPNQQGGNQQQIQIPGLGNVTIPNLNQGGQQGGQNQSPGNIQLPGGITLPNPLPRGDGGAQQGGPTARRDPPARGSLPPPTPGSYDSGGHMTRAFMDTRARAINQALVSSLDPRERTQTQTIPFHIVNQAREPNAAAGCTKTSRQAVMLITSAMLVLVAGISEATAFDEVANTKHYNVYADEVVRQVRSKLPVGAVPPTLLTGPMALDTHKLARQEHLFDQQIAFILGHELAHHYRGHTSCVGGRSAAQAEADELTRILAHTVPLFSQPREVEADMWGVVNLLEAGGQRPQGSWNEEGALLNLDFFGRLRQRGGSELAMLFLSTHPAPQLRAPIVRTAVRQWRPGWRPPATPSVDGTGPGLQIPTPGGNIRLPINLPSGS